MNGVERTKSVMCLKKQKIKINSVTEVILIFVLGWMYPFISQCCEHLIYI